LDIIGENLLSLRYAIDETVPTDVSTWDIIVPLPHKDKRPQASTTVFGNEPGVVDQMTSSGTAVITAVHEDAKHEMSLLEQEMLSLRQDDSRSLGNFLSRPQMIYNQNIDVGFAYRIPALYILLSNPRVRDKIRGYAYLNGQLHIKVTVTSSPLNSGAVHVALCPWGSTDTGRGALANSAETDLLTHAQMSQLPNFVLDLGTERGGEISMPIICPTNGLNITKEDQIRDAFTLHFRTLISPQRPPTHNSISTMNVYAWLTDVSLTGTTLSSELPGPQGDEYQRDSADIPPASNMSFRDAIAASSRKFVGKAADLAGDAALATLGFSQPIQPGGPITVIPRSTTNLANYNSEQHIDSLAGDIKNQVPVGTKELGFEDIDHMSLDNILDRWGLMASYTMPTNDGNFSFPIYRIPVHPLGCTEFTLGSQTNWSPIPVNIAALAFSKWRGTMVYKFHAVGSALLKGKIAIRHDVVGDYDNTKFLRTDTHALNTVIWDLSTTREIIIEVPWTSNLPFKPTAALQQGLQTLTSTTVSATTNQTHNGALFLSEVSPVSDGELANVGILIYAKGKKGMVFGDLRPVLANYTFAGINNGTSGIPEPQGSEEQKIPYGVLIDEAGLPVIFEYNALSVKYMNEYHLRFSSEQPQVNKEPQAFITNKSLDTSVFTGEDPTSHVTINIAGLDQSIEDDDAMASICLGEKYFNIRQVIKRYTMNWIRQVSFPNNRGYYQIRIPDRPLIKGWQGPLSINTDPAGKKCVYARDSFLSFYSCCFLGYRGSFNHKVVTNPSNSLYETNLQVSRTTPGFSEIQLPWNFTTFNTSASAITSSADFRSGGILNVSSVNPVVEYSTPYQSRAKFSWAKDITPYLLKDTDDGGYDGSWHQIRATSNGTGFRYITVEKYVAAGDDFSLFFYMYAPTMVATSPGPFPAT
jgi:hypothetical protein